ncbi:MULTISPECIES: anti-sigma factor domain-containing protein [unclassified Saccharopolyspora]|uniref:anti-sigma factor n=1 Tax=unclassified Saccharopolyspora TaxID=2646250 RepID=UPI001CD1D139|nr:MULTISPECIES: anti-sigma factor [unclassified Saccharopolyspora]MCA1229484.1 anti-sigma factor [Saccharopolyspora sp. 6M]MCA1283458.1 anti-sigma factor [Saccharopolyspora sp. 7B]
MSTDLATLTGAYAVDALPDDERAEFEAHLDSCEDCTQEVQELREAAARLGSAEQSAPPEALKQRVLAEIAQTRQDPPPPADLAGHAAKRRRRYSWATRLSVAAAAVGVALAAVFGVVAVRAQQELDAARDRMTAAGTRGAEISAVLQAPDARVINTPGPEGMRATTVLSHAQGKAMFMATGMAPPPADRAYQVWFIEPGGSATSAGMLTAAGADDTEPLIAAMPPDTAQLGVTVEPEGGSPAPTTTPILMLPTT